MDFCHSLTTDACDFYSVKQSSAAISSFFRLQIMLIFNIVTKFQVTEHMLFHFSKPSLVIIYDLETNHDCLCLGYLPWIYSTINAISPLSAWQGFSLCLHSRIKNVLGCATPRSSPVCGHIHLCIVYTHGFMSCGKCTCPSALGHMFPDWFAHRGAAGALQDECLHRCPVTPISVELSSNEL